MFMRVFWFTARSMEDLCSTTQNSIAENLCIRGHDVTIVNGDWNIDLQDKTWNHIGLRYKPLQGVRSISLGKAMKKWIATHNFKAEDYALVEWRVVRWVAPELEKKGISWALIDRSPPAFAGILAKIQWIFWKKAWRLAARSKSSGFVVSKQHADFVKVKTGYKNSKVLTAGVDLEMFNVGERNRPLTMVYHGRLDQNRGVFSLPMFAQKIVNAGVKIKLVMIGTGDSFEALSALSDEKSFLQVYGTLPTQKIAQILSQCHIGLLPMPDSKVWRLASPLKRSEYLASGLLVFGIDHSGHQIEGAGEWMKLVAQGEFHTEGLTWIQSLDENTLEALSKEARKYAENTLNWSRTVDVLEKVLDSKILH